MVQIQINSTELERLTVKINITISGLLFDRAADRANRLKIRPAPFSQRNKSWFLKPEYGQGQPACSNLFGN